MTKIFNFALKIKGGGREGGTCEVLRPCHPPPPPKIWNVHLIVDLRNAEKSIDHKQVHGKFRLQTFRPSISSLVCI